MRYKKTIGFPKIPINDRELIDYFIYVYDLYEKEEGDIKEIKTIYKNHFKNIKSKNYSFNQKWLYLNLMKLKDMAEQYNYIYTVELISYLIDNLTNINEKELLKYINIINHSFKEDMYENLSIRLIELENFEDVYNNTNLVIKILLLNKLVITDFIKEIIKKTDLNYVVYSNIHNKLSKYKGRIKFWDIYFEMFLNNLSISYEDPLSHNNINEALSFFDNTITDKNKCNLIKNFITKVITKVATNNSLQTAY